MSRRPRPVAAVVGLATEVLAAARTGEVQDIFIVVRDSDGEYQSMFEADDLADMLFELGSEIIRLRSVVTAASDQSTPRPR